MFARFLRPVTSTVLSRVVLASAPARAQLLCTTKPASIAASCRVVSQRSFNRAMSSQASKDCATLLPVLEEMKLEKQLFIPSEAARKLKQRLNWDNVRLLEALVPHVKQYAVPPLSKFYVGAAARGQTGNIYLGVNLEFNNASANMAVHAEQAAISNAFLHGEERITNIAVSAAPCGHCRQFMNETNKADEIMITFKGESYSLPELLPHSFGPRDLGNESPLLAPQGQNFLSPTQLVVVDGPHRTMEDPLVQAAYEAAKKSYTPYTKSPAGAAIFVGSTGDICSGSFLENSAFNPGLPAISSALIAFKGTGNAARPFIEISAAVLIERAGGPSLSQIEATKVILASIAPQATVTIMKI